jgi:hypothetical protein
MEIVREYFQYIVYQLVNFYLIISYYIGHFPYFGNLTILLDQLCPVFLTIHGRIFSITLKLPKQLGKLDIFR